MILCLLTPSPSASTGLVTVKIALSIHEGTSPSYYMPSGYGKLLRFSESQAFLLHPTPYQPSYFLRQHLQVAIDQLWVLNECLWQELSLLGIEMKVFFLLACEDWECALTPVAEDVSKANFQNIKSVSRRKISTSRKHQGNFPTSSIPWSQGQLLLPLLADGASFSVVKCHINCQSVSRAVQTPLYRNTKVETKAAMYWVLCKDENFLYFIHKYIFLGI